MDFAWNRIIFYCKEDFIWLYEMFRTSLNIQNGDALDDGFEVLKRL